METVTFNIKATMSEEQARAFCTMLKEMMAFGSRGHSDVIGMYVDGDGAFHPKFEFDQEFESVHPIRYEGKDYGLGPTVGVLFYGE